MRIILLLALFLGCSAQTVVVKHRGGGATWATSKAFIFCSTSNCGGVTIPSNTQVVNSQSFPQTTTIGGESVVWGWCAGSISAADRTLSGDHRIAGINYVAVGTTGDFCVTLPSTGSVTVDLAGGDAGANWVQYYYIYDNTSLRATIWNGLTTNCNSTGQLGFIDASGSCWQNTGTVGDAWSAGHATAAFTFSTNTFKFRMGNAGGSTFNTVAYLQLTN
jgi:hypothetical protein